jgi:hypothetical protein
LIDYAARHLQAVEGRFLQADTVIPVAGALLSYNRYIYTSNNPVNRIDPTGHADTPDWFYQLAQTGNRVTEAWNQFAEGLGDASTMAQAAVETQYPLLGAWRRGVEAFRGFAQCNAQTNPSPENLVAFAATAALPATVTDLALTALDVIDGPAPDVTAARTSFAWRARGANATFQLWDADVIHNSAAYSDAVSLIYRPETRTVESVNFDLQEVLPKGEGIYDALHSEILNSFDGGNVQRWNVRIANGNADAFRAKGLEGTPSHFLKLRNGMVLDDIPPSVDYDFSYVQRRN